MKGWLLLLVCCCLERRALAVGDFLCVSDYFVNISCAWNGSRTMDFSNFSMKFTEWTTGREVSCPITLTDRGYFCDCSVTSMDFQSSDKYSISLCNRSSCQVLNDSFIPSENIKLSPPPQLEVKESPETVSITCKIGRYEDHMYIKSNSVLDFEVLLQESRGKERKMFPPSSAHNTLMFNKTSQLTPNRRYCVQAKFKPRRYSSATWSEWSEPVCWGNDTNEVPPSEAQSMLSILLKSLGPLCVSAGVLVFVLHCPAARLKIKTLSRAPTPAPFFKPLFHQHEGNLQEWLSPQHKYVLTHAAEEVLAVDAVTVLPNATTKGPEETWEAPSSAVTHLLFPPGQSAYVGLPGLRDSAPPLTASLCPGDTPYTQLPLSIWALDLSDVEVVSSAPKTLLESSRSDSGCSFDDLTESLDLSRSPESSLPSSPVQEIPAPPRCSDYCILNKTAGGVVPVLLSKEAGRNVPAHVLKAQT